MMSTYPPDAAQNLDGVRLQHAYDIARRAGARPLTEFKAAHGVSRSDVQCIIQVQQSGPTAAVVDGATVQAERRGAVAAGSPSARRDLTFELVALSVRLAAFGLITAALATGAMNARTLPCKESGTPWSYNSALDWMRW